MIAAIKDEADHGFERHRKPTRRDAFLETMNQVVPCEALCAVVEPYYPKKENERPPIAAGANATHPFPAALVQPGGRACEEALYDSASLRRFTGIDLGNEFIPDATTLLKLRRLLE